MVNETGLGLSLLALGVSYFAICIAWSFWPEKRTYRDDGTNVGGPVKVVNHWLTFDNHMNVEDAMQVLIYLEIAKRLNDVRMDEVKITDIQQQEDQPNNQGLFAVVALDFRAVRTFCPIYRNTTYADIALQVIHTLDACRAGLRTLKL